MEQTSASLFVLVFRRKDSVKQSMNIRCVQIWRIYPPGSGIWWPRVELAFKQIRWQIYPPGSAI